MTQKQTQHLRQQQELRQLPSQQTILLMRLMQYNNVALEQEILNNLAENPALEREEDNEEMPLEGDTFTDEAENPALEKEADNEEIPLEGDTFTDKSVLDDYLNEDEYDPNYEQANTSSFRDQIFERTLPYHDTFQEQLQLQLSEIELDERQYQITEIILGNLDEKGYLARDLKAMCSDLLLTYNISTTETELTELLTSVIQQFDPPGVGARNLRECLLLQLQRKPENPAITLANQILTSHFDTFAKKHYTQLCKLLHINKAALQAAIHEITKLHPYPASDTDENANRYIEPDFTISRNGNELLLSLNNDFLPKLIVNPTFETQCKAFSGTPKNEKEAYIKERVDDARNFINMLSQRESTLEKTMRCIMQRQKAYFLSGDEIDIKPMILKDIAKDTAMDISSISRIVNRKYVATDFGTILLKSLFSESAGSEDVSSITIKKLISDFIKTENGQAPLDDQALCNLLNDKGCNIKRRTVAKYREQLGFPVARLRRTL
jgi:RNA polymerase sigma-54 factor